MCIVPDKPMISFNVVKAQSHDAAAEQIVTCNAESIPLSDVTISYVDDTGKNVTHACPSSPACQITVALPDTKVTCTAVYQTSLFDAVKYLKCKTLNCYYYYYYIIIYIFN